MHDAVEACGIDVGWLVLFVGDHSAFSPIAAPVSRSSTGVLLVLLAVYWVLGYGCAVVEDRGFACLSRFCCF